MIGRVAIAIALPGFNDYGRSMTPVLLSMDHFLCRFLKFSEKVKKSIDKKFDFFAKCTILALRLSVRRFQIPLEGLSCATTLATFGIIYATNLLLQNMTKIVCLH